MNVRALAVALALTVAPLAIAGCGGDDDSKVSPSTRIERCVAEYPDSTKSDCSEWEADGKLDDDGMHTEHEDM